MTPAKLPLVLILLASAVPAQLGRSKGFKVDVQAAASSALAATYDGCFGVARDGAGSFWVTARRASPAGAHKLLRFDSGGVFVGAYDQPATTSASSDGLRDLAYDPIANVLYAGCEVSASGGKICAFDVGQLAWSAALAVNVPPTIVTSVVGLAYDYFGNNGLGSLYVSDPSGAVTECKKDGTVIRTLWAPVTGCTGIAIDTGRRLLWFAGSGGSTRPGAGLVLAQLDIASGQPTGQMLLGDTSVPGTPAGGVSGGLEFTEHSHLRHVEPWLLVLTQATSDTIYELGGRFQTGSTCGGTIGFKNDAAYVGNTQWCVTLSGSSSAYGYLMLQTANKITPLVPPVFGLGCAAQVALTTPPITIGPLPIYGGATQLTIPVTAGAGGSVWFQWIEVTNPITTPILLSDGGGVVIHD